MPRPKGSKNKPRRINDFAALLAEKTSAREQIISEITELTANLDSLRTQLKEKKNALKTMDKEIAKLEAEKAAADAKAAEEAKKAELDEMLQKLLDSGMSVEEILGKLK